MKSKLLRLLDRINLRDGDDQGAFNEGGFDAFLDTHLGSAEPAGGGKDDTVVEKTDVSETDSAAQESDSVDTDDPVEDPSGDSDMDDSDGDDSDGSDDVDRFAALEEKLSGLAEQNKMLKDLLIEKAGKVESKDSEEEPEISNPLESEMFEKLSEGMGWDSDEQKMMKTFFESMLAYSTNTTLSQAQSTVSDIVQSRLSTAQKQEAVKKAFFEENRELKAVPQFVGQLSKEVVKEFKERGKALDAASVLNEVATRAYKVLGIKKATQKKEPEPGRGKKPAFASSGGSRKKPSEISDDQKMIENIMKLDM